MSNVFKDYNKSLDENLPGQIGTIESETNPLASLSQDTKPEWLREVDYALGLATRPAGAANVANPTFRSGASSITKSGANIDPDILARRQRGLDMAGDSLRDLQQSRIGDRQDFLNKRVDPLRAGIQQQQTELTERQQKTGVAGSEFGKQSQESFKVQSQQKLDQGEAMAFDELMSVASQFDQSEGNLLKLQEQIKTSQFAQDAQAKGMSAQLLSSLIDIDLTERGIRQDTATSQQQQTGNALSLVASFFSSRTFKHDFKGIDNHEILNSMMEISVEKWKYKGDDEVHIGCYAEDFNERFGNKNDKTISVVDIIGVLMASVQAQQEQIEELKQCL